jgi:ribosomal protein S18 acetylase RimI-like enzyme
MYFCTTNHKDIKKLYWKQKQMIRIRRAEISDATYIAEGIFSAFLLEDNAILLGSDAGEGGVSLREKWMEILTDVCVQENTHYSYRNTFIAELDGEIAGMMIAVDGKNYRFQRENMYPQLKGLFDVAFGKGWEEMEDEAKAGEYYIDSLAVSLPYRNQGVGTALIEKAKEMAREKGIGVVTLAVEPENRAKRLYQQLGFGYQRRIEIFNEEYELYAAEIVV